MKKPLYTRGDAAAYWAWLEHQDPHVARLASQYRPWEIYKMDDGRGELVRIVGYDANEKVGLLHVIPLKATRENQMFTVTDGQVILYGVLGFEDADKAAA